MSSTPISRGNANAFEGTKTDKQKNDEERSKRFAKETAAAEIYSGVFCLVGGPENLDNRELSPRKLRKLMDKTGLLETVANKANRINEPDRIIWNPDNVWEKVEKFRENHLFTSAKAIRGYFSARDAATLIIEFNMGSGTGHEVPEEDIPFKFQEVIPREIANLSRTRVHNFLSAYMDQDHIKDDLMDMNIQTPEQLEISYNRRMELLETKEVLDQIEKHVNKRRGEPTFKKRDFKKLLQKANHYRNVFAHNESVSTDFMREALENTRELCDMLALDGDDSWNERISHLIGELKRWDRWSKKNKAESIKEHKQLLKDVKYYYQELKLSRGRRASGRRAYDKQERLAEKKAMSVKILRKRLDDRYDVGKPFAKHVAKIFDGSEEKFEFPKSREPIFKNMDEMSDSTESTESEDSDSEDNEDSEEHGDDEEHGESDQEGGFDTEASTATIDNFDREIATKLETLENSGKETRVKQKRVGKRSAEDAGFEVSGESKAKKPRVDCESEAKTSDERLGSSDSSSSQPPTVTPEDVTLTKEPSSSDTSTKASHVEEILEIPPSLEISPISGDLTTLPAETPSSSSNPIETIQAETPLSSSSLTTTPQEEAPSSSSNPNTTLQAEPPSSSEIPPSAVISTKTVQAEIKTKITQLLQEKVTIQEIYCMLGEVTAFAGRTSGEASNDEDVVKKEDEELKQPVKREG